MMHAPPFAARSASNPSLIDLDMLLRLTADAVLVRPNHASAELVQNLKGGLVARQAQLPLKLDGGDAGCLSGDQVGSSKPD
jgi:hypothetical protein